MNAVSNAPQLAHNVTRCSHLDLPGAGQVYVAGRHAYIGHIPNAQQLGTSILDVADPKNPRIVACARPIVCSKTSSNDCQAIFSSLAMIAAR